MEFRIELQRLVVILQRPVELAVADEHVGAVVVGVCLAGVALDRCVVVA
jgi:hypothetical protein